MSASMRRISPPWPLSTPGSTSNVERGTIYLPTIARVDGASFDLAFYKTFDLLRRESSLFISMSTIPCLEINSRSHSGASAWLLRRLWQPSDTLPRAAANRSFMLDDVIAKQHGNMIVIGPACSTEQCVTIAFHIILIHRVKAHVMVIPVSSSSMCSLPRFSSSRPNAASSRKIIGNGLFSATDNEADIGNACTQTFIDQKGDNGHIADGEQFFRHHFRPWKACAVAGDGGEQPA